MEVEELVLSTNNGDREMLGLPTRETDEESESDNDLTPDDIENQLSKQKDHYNPFGAFKGQVWIC